jgi:phosphoribosylglycinamide formyltransferase 1
MNRFETTQKNIVCLISGRGSNFGALLRAAQAEHWQQLLHAHFACVISNRADAIGLRVAQDAGVVTRVVDHQDHASREAFDAALAQAIDEYQPAVVVLAGFMRVLTASFVQRYEGRLINIHPSLLPSFPGLATHRQALAAGVRLHGATVHFVSAEVDAGAIIAQAAVPVLPGDTEELLAARVLSQEHLLLPRCVRWFLEGKIVLQDTQTVVNGIDPTQFAWMAA